MVSQLVVQNQIKRFYHVLLLASFSICASFYFFRSNLGIQLGPIDDHEIVRFLGSDKQLWIWQIPSVLLTQTEVGQYAESTRFRPTYYVLRLLETSAFGIDSTSWYFSRIIMVALTCLFLTLGLLILLSIRNVFVDLFFGAWFTLTILGLSAWQGIIARLGPSEIYLVLGISIFFYSATLLMKNPSSTKLWVLCCLSVLIAAGSKENGALFIAPFMLLGGYVSYSSAKKRTVLWLYFSTLTLALIIATGWILGVRQAGANVYGDTITKQFLLDQLSQHLRNTSSSGIFMFSLLVVLIHIYVNILTKNELSRSFYFVFFSHIIISLVLLGELIFYPRGFTELRYAVVSQMLTQVSLGLSVVLIINTLRILRISEKILGLLSISAFALIIVNSTYPNFLIAKAGFEAVSKSARGDGEWQEQLKLIRQDLLSKPYDAVVIQLNESLHGEFAYAMSHYLEFYESRYPRYLNIAPIENISVSAMNALMDISIKGSSNWMIEPISLLDSDARVYCVTLFGAEKEVILGTQEEVTLCDN